MPKKEPDTIKPFEVSNGESYIFRTEDFGDAGCKVTLIDPRDLDILDRDRYHAVVLGIDELTILKRWINEVLYIQKFKGA